MKRLPLLSLFTAALGTILLGCNESDCSLSRTSYANFSFLDSESHAAVTFTEDIVVTGFIYADVVVKEELPDGSIVETVVKDSLLSDTLYNRPQNSMSLPLSYTTKTTYVMHYTERMKDTIELYHKPIPFVSHIECSPMIFYQVEGINYTTNALDSIVIVNPDINNEEKNNFQIYYTLSSN
ncbi:MAG: DUF6452 family protein [Phocaeicola sp.]